MGVDILDESPGPSLSGAKSDEEKQPRFVGVELYFENLDQAKEFYAETLALEISDEIRRDTTCFCCKNQLERRYCAPKRTDTNFETPGSCMVTP